MIALADNSTDRQGVATGALPVARTRLNVVHLVLSLNVGGLEKVVYDLVRRADDSRLAVRVVCLGPIGEWGPKFEALGVPVESLDVLNRGTWGRTLAVARRLRELRPDVLHTHNPAPHLVGALASRLAGVPVVIHTKHGRNYPGNRKWVWANRLAAWLSNKVVAVSGDAAAVATDIERVPPSKVAVIRNGVDLSRFHAVERQPTGNQRRAVHVARISFDSKDQETLVRAVRMVVDIEPDFVLDIVGDGPDRANLEALCDRLELRRHVNFAGFRENIHDYLSQAEFFVLSSVTEGISLTLLEAAASGLAIVATRVGGNPEVVADGETGLLVPPRSPDDLATAMLALLADRDRAAAMGRAGRLRIEEQFDLTRAVAAYEDLYHSLRNGTP
jgi:sugar transferase (PEP-CTERM/EpsH1 system associated)